MWGGESYGGVFILGFEGFCCSFCCYLGVEVIEIVMGGELVI